MQKNYFTYILTNKPYGTLYIGMTSDLLGRAYQHKNKTFEGFSRRYSLDKIVYFEYSNDVNATVRREKQLKKWNRQWKINLIEEFNPDWKDLYENLIRGVGLPNRFPP